MEIIKTIYTAGFHNITFIARVLEPQWMRPQFPLRYFSADCNESVEGWFCVFYRDHVSWVQLPA